MTWDLGDGTVSSHESCPPVVGSCLEWPQTYSTDGWYDVTVTVETADEIAVADPPGRRSAIPSRLPWHPSSRRRRTHDPAVDQSRL